MQETRVRSLGREDPPEKEMATHLRLLAWRIPWTEKPGRLQSMGSQESWLNKAQTQPGIVQLWHDWVANSNSLSSQQAPVVKSLPASAGDIRDLGSIPGSGGYPGEGNDDPLQYSCLENPMDRAAWWATVHGVAKSQIRLKQLNTHTPLTQTWYHEYNLVIS